MTNFEHYKDEIEKAINDKTLASFLKEHDKCWDTYCSTLYDSTKWYLAEYVEPYRLTGFEKDVLENTDDRFKYVCKNGQSEYVWIRYQEETNYCCLNAIFPKIKLDCLEWDKEYKIADILDNCEVID